MGRKAVESLRGADYEILLACVQSAHMASGLSKKAICDRLGKPRNYLNKVETGEKRLDVVELFQLCEAMGTDPLKLLTDFAFHRTTSGSPPIR